MAKIDYEDDETVLPLCGDRKCHRYNYKASQSRAFDIRHNIKGHDKKRQRFATPKYYIGWAQKKSHSDYPAPKVQFSFSAIDPSDYNDKLDHEVRGCEDWDCKEVSYIKYMEINNIQQ